MSEGYYSDYSYSEGPPDPKQSPPPPMDHNYSDDGGYYTDDERPDDQPTKSTAKTGEYSDYFDDENDVNDKNNTKNEQIQENEMAKTDQPEKSEENKEEKPETISVTDGMKNASKLVEDYSDYSPDNTDGEKHNDKYDENEDKQDSMFIGTVSNAKEDEVPAIKIETDPKEKGDGKPAQPPDTARHSYQPRFRSKFLPTAPSSSRPTYRRPLPPLSPAPADPQLKAAAMKMSLKGEITPAEYASLINELSNDRTQLLMSGNIQQGLQINRVVEYVQGRQREEQNRSHDSARAEEVQSARESIEMELTRFDAETAELERDIDARAEEQRQKLEQQQQQEREEMVAFWQTDQKQRQYNHASPALMGLRRQLLVLIKAGRFNELEAVQRDADALEAAEMEQSYRAMQHDFNEAYKKLQVKHEAEKAAAAMSTENAKDRLRVQRGRNRQVIEKKESVLELKAEFASSKSPRNIQTRAAATRWSVPEPAMQARMLQSSTIHLPPLKVPQK